MIYITINYRDEQHRKRSIDLHPSDEHARVYLWELAEWADTTYGGAPKEDRLALVFKCVALVTKKCIQLLGRLLRTLKDWIKYIITAIKEF